VYSDELLGFTRPIVYSTDQGYTSPRNKNKPQTEQFTPHHRAASFPGIGFEYNTYVYKTNTR